MAIKKYGVRLATKTCDETDVHCENLRRNGYTVVKSGLDADQLASLKSKILKLKIFYVKNLKKIVDLIKVDEHNTIRAPFLFDREFLDISFNKNLIQVVEKILNGNFILNQQNVIINPGKQDYNQAAWHRDLPYQHFTISNPLAVNALFCVDDFTIENGSTFVLPASHFISDFPSEKFVVDNEIQISAKKGDYILIDSMLYHKGGFNSTDQDRIGVNNVFSSPIIRRQIDFSEESFEFNVDNLDEYIRSRLGLQYKSHRSIEEFLQSRIK